MHQQPTREGSRPDMTRHEREQVSAGNTFRDMHGFEAAGLAVWQRSKGRLWIPLLWLIGIPISTLLFLTMLFWAYGVEG
jgi:hypothetical protein